MATILSTEVSKSRQETSLPTPDGFKRIDGFPNYAINSCGDILSSRQTNGTSWRLLKQATTSSGKKVTLRKDGKNHQFLVHILVKTTFDTECPEGMECCHNDGNNLNNSIDNLRWDTHRNNELDKITHGTLPIGQRNGNSKLSEEAIRMLFELRESGYTQQYISEFLNISRGHVGNILSKTRRKHIDN